MSAPKLTEAQREALDGVDRHGHVRVRAVRDALLEMDLIYLSDPGCYSLTAAGRAALDEGAR